MLASCLVDWRTIKPVIEKDFYRLTNFEDQVISSTENVLDMLRRRGKVEYPSNFQLLQC